MSTNVLQLSKELVYDRGCKGKTEINGSGVKIIFEENDGKTERNFFCNLFFACFSHKTSVTSQAEICLLRINKLIIIFLHVKIGALL